MYMNVSSDENSSTFTLGTAIGAGPEKKQQNRFKIRAFN